MNKNGPKFVRYFGPMLDALRALGSSGTPQEVASTIAQTPHKEVEIEK
jgi:hypothetical protein